MGRAPTNIEVSVPDLTGFHAGVLGLINEERGKKGLPLADTVVGQCYGYVDTPNGVFALCSEGVGSSIPVSVQNPVDVEFYAQGTGEKGRWSGCFPEAIERLDADQLRNLPVSKKINLAQFIRSFGARLENNYYEWKNLLERAMKNKKRKGT
jgi:hypothetical protein